MGMLWVMCKMPTRRSTRPFPARVKPGSGSGTLCSSSLSLLPLLSVLLPVSPAIKTNRCLSSFSVLVARLWSGLGSCYFIPRLLVIGCLFLSCVFILLFILILPLVYLCMLRTGLYDQFTEYTSLSILSFAFCFKSLSSAAFPSSVCVVLY